MFNQIRKPAPDRAARRSLSSRFWRVLSTEGIRAIRHRFCSSEFEELLRILSMQLFLAPAAFLLPRRSALFLADALTLLLMVCPTLGPKEYRHRRKVYGRSRLESAGLAWAWLARPYRDFVVLKRINYGCEHPEQWRIAERNSGGIDALRASGKSYIIATGHFSRETLFGLFARTRPYGHLVHTSYPLPSRWRSMRDIRVAVQLGNLIRASQVWDKNAETVYVGVDPLPFRTLFRRLRVPGNVVFLHIDVWTKKAPVGTYERPFASWLKRDLSTGAAQLARTAECPVVSCVHSLLSDGTVQLEWGDPIYQVDNDIAVMEKLIAPIELAVGRNPTQFPPQIGSERRWNPTTVKWEDLPN